MTNVERLEQELLASIDIGIPPVLESLHTYTENTFKNIDDLAIHKKPISDCIIKRNVDLDSLFFVLDSAPHSYIHVEHDPVTGKLIRFSEEFLGEGTNQSSKHSLSLDRKPSHLSEGIRGNIANRPFLPGGIKLEEKKLKLDDDFLDFKNLLKKPPNFTMSYEFERKAYDWLMSDESELLHVSKFGKSKKLSKAIEEENGNVDDEDDFSPNVIKLAHRIDTSSNTQQESSEENKEGQKFVTVVDLNQPIDNFKELVDPVITYPFELDTFQKQAILQMESRQNVFVAAHTSAGKTVVAEYAIALSLNHMTKVIYTSPIKALSNQKFRDFKLKFSEVGLITGDIQINLDASVLVMTTEILRSMLYNGSDVIRDLEWVIFDEVHYINDPERGVVWEEVLILLPGTVKIVFLSATVPNSREFAEWVGRIKKKQVYVISTPKRPVPLEHYLYTGNSPNTANELFLLVNAEGQFLTSGYNSSMEAKKKRVNKSLQQYGGKGTKNYVNPKQEQQIWTSLINQLDKTNRTPAVAFVFSKKRIDNNCTNLNKLNLLSSKEKSAVVTFFRKSIKLLKPIDQTLPQVLLLEELLQRGIGIHHSGILPIIKEIVEMLFQRGLVKVLFATETFAMGVNMPAKTVIFDSIEKHDGERMRNLLPGEYIQMAGRAGRRGLDKTGTVIILCKNEVPEISDLHQMMLGKPTMLTSKFRITYLMVLSLLRVEELNVEDVMMRSFGEFLTLKQSMKLQVKVDKLKEELEKMIIKDDANDEAELKSYYDNISEYQQLLSKLRETSYKKMKVAKTLSVGRVLVLKSVGDVTDVVGVVLANNMRDKSLTVFVLADQRLEEGSAQKVKKNLQPNIDFELYSPSEDNGEVTGKVLDVRLDNVGVVCSKVLKVTSAPILDDINRRKMMQYRKEEPSHATLNLMKDIKQLMQNKQLSEMKFDLSDPDSAHDFHRLEALKELILQSSLASNQDNIFKQKFEKFHERRELESMIREESKLLKKDYFAMFPEYNQKLQVLKHLNFVDNNNLVRLKGRVACEINVQELLVTEMIFQNMFSTLPTERIASLLSCLVFQQKRCSEPNLSAGLLEVKKSLLTMAKNLTEVQRYYGLMTDDLEEQCNFGLMEVIHEWALGVPFSKLVELTDVQEGVIVKCIQRLDDLFQDLVKVAKVIGDPVLCKKMEEGSRLIRRDIVFAASLYLQ